MNSVTRQDIDFSNINAKLTIQHFKQEIKNILEGV